MDASDMQNMMAGRAYAYRIFHIVFGADPSTEMLRLLGSDMTRQALSLFASESSAGSTNDADRLETASPNGLGEDLAHDSTRRRMAIKRSLDLCTYLADQAGNGQRVEELRREHDRTLVLPGLSYVHPWESPYVGKETMLFQPSTLDVRARYATYGYVAKDKGHFPEDHVAMMCDFLAELALRTHDACAREQPDEAQAIVADQASFIENHLLTWLPKFVTKLAEKNQDGTYASFAAALLAFVEDDHAYLASLR